MATFERVGVKKTGKKKLREEFLHYILQWNPKWFCGENTSATIPIKLKPSLLVYESYNDYSQIQLLSLIYDIWNELEDLRKYTPINRRMTSITLSKTSTPLRCVSVNSADNKVCVIRMKAILSSYFNTIYVDRGNLVKFKNPLNENLEEFAFVDNVKRNNLPRSGKCQLTYDLIVKHQENMKIPSEINLETVPVPVSVYMNFLDSLINLSESPLCRIILKPNFEDYEFPSNDYSDAIQPVIEDKLNSKQLHIISRIVKTVEEKKPGIFMASGPPGSGKSKVIVHSILSIISRESTDKILVFGQSNLAIDAIVLQLLRLEAKLKDQGISLNIVRIGRQGKMNDQVKSVSFERLQQGQRKNYGCELIRNAKIIAGTISSYNSYMRPFFKDVQIPVCIIDEAQQASELETCVPLLLGVRTMILVGDSHQFSPKIYSEEVKKQNLGQSLFSRAQKIFENNEKNPILTLDTQYRMNEAIVEWPNKYFYKGAIKNCVSTRPLGIYNYRVLNHSYHDDEEGWINVEEAKLVVNIAYILMTQMNMEVLKDRIHLGIIVLSDRQHELMVEMVEKRTSDICQEQKNKFQLRVVKTSEAFQGTECDIIILSCVRSSDHKYIDDPNRLCVSLTRAKHTLIICGNFNEYKSNEMWSDLIKDSQNRNAFFTIGRNDKTSLLKRYLINVNNN